MGQCAGQHGDSRAGVLALRRGGRRDRQGWGRGAAGPRVRELRGASAQECGAAECVQDGPLGAGGTRPSCGRGPGAGCEGVEAGTWAGAGPERGVSSRGSDFLPEAVESPAGLVKPGSAVAKFGVLVGEVVV